MFDEKSSQKKRKRRVYESRYPYYVIVLSTMLITAVVVALLTWGIVSGSRESLAVPGELTTIPVVGCTIRSISDNYGLQVLVEPVSGETQRIIAFPQGAEATGVMEGWYRVVYNGYHGWVINNDRSVTEGNCSTLPVVTAGEVPPLPRSNRTDGCWLYAFHQAYDSPGTPLYGVLDNYSVMNYLPIGYEIEANAYYRGEGFNRYSVHSEDGQYRGWVEAAHVTVSGLCDNLYEQRVVTPLITPTSVPRSTLPPIYTHTPAPLVTLTPSYTPSYTPSAIPVLMSTETPVPFVPATLVDCQMQVREATQLNAMLNDNRWIADLAPGEIVTAKLYGGMDGYVRYQVLTGFNKIGWVDAALLDGTCSDLPAPTPIAG